MWTWLFVTNTAALYGFKKIHYFKGGICSHNKEWSLTLNMPLVGQIEEIHGEGNIFIHLLILQYL